MSKSGSPYVYQILKEHPGPSGPDGHGKTTLLNMVSGLIHTSQGNMLFGDMGVAETLELAAFSSRAAAATWREMAYTSPIYFGGHV